MRSLYRSEKMINCAILSLIIAPLTWIVVLIYAEYIRLNGKWCIKCVSVSESMIASYDIHCLVIISTIIASIALVIGFIIRNQQLEKLMRSYKIEGCFKLNDRIPILSTIVILALVTTTYYGCKRYVQIHKISAASCFCLMPVVQYLHARLTLKIRRFEWKYYQATFCNWIYHYCDAIYYHIFTVTTSFGTLFFLSGYMVTYDKQGLYPYYGEWLGVISMMGYYVMYSVTIYRDNRTIKLIDERKFAEMHVMNDCDGVCSNCCCVKCTVPYKIVSTL